MKKNLLMLSFCGLSIIGTAQNRFAPISNTAMANKVTVTGRNATLMDNEMPLKKANPTTAPISRNGGGYPANKNGGGYPTVNALTDQLVGQTDYDLQTNASTYPHVVKNADGTICAVWTMIPNGGASADRGTGYNYWDGTSWGAPPLVKIEPGTVRTGFTNIAVTGSGQEATFAHSSTDHVVYRTYRTPKGSGTWLGDANGLKSSGANNTDTWSRAVPGGANNNSIHVIVNDNLHGNDGGSLLYSRSTDEGLTWNPLRVQIPGLDSVSYPYWLGGDSYNIATKGDVIAVVVGDITTDIALVKSTDNGATWTKTQITHQWAGGSYLPGGDPTGGNTVGNISDIDLDGVADTVWSCGGDVNVVIDNNNMCHVFWGVMRMLDDSADINYTNFGVFLSTNGIAYWNETMPTIPTTTDGSALNIIAGATDWNGDGSINVPENAQPGWPAGELTWARYGNMGLAGIPSAAIAPDNTIYLAFQALDESADTALYGKAHFQVYVVTSKDNGVTWDAIPRNVVTDGGNSDSLYFEAIFPSIAKQVDGQTIYLQYQRDYIPGNYALGGTGTVDETNNDPLNNVTDIVVTQGPIVTGVNEIAAQANSFTVSQNSPNPSNNTTDIGITLTKTSDVKIEVTNVTGQVLFTNEQGKMAPGTHVLNLNTSSYGAGVYFYNVTVNGEKVTKKMIVE